MATVIRKVSILGATGSVGKSTLDLIERSPGRFDVVALTAATNAAALAQAAIRTGARLAVVADEANLPELEQALAGSHCRAAAGREALIEAAAGEADWVMAAIVGCAGLEPVMAAVEAGCTLALANKEALVTAGSLMTDAAVRAGATILPVDSEHNAIFQCLAGNRLEDVAKIGIDRQRRTVQGDGCRRHGKGDARAGGCPSPIGRWAPRFQSIRRR
jgi:1-deoxy-D-xylulose-5-phosphate reductoisomerase